QPLSSAPRTVPLHDALPICIQWLSVAWGEVNQRCIGSQLFQVLTMLGETLTIPDQVWIRSNNLFQIWFAVETKVVLNGVFVVLIGQGIWDQTDWSCC